MPSRIQALIQLPTLEAKTAQPRVLMLGEHVRVLFIERTPWAVLDGEVFYPDLPEELTPTIMRLIHSWTIPGISTTRLPPEEWDYLLVSSMLRSLRPLLRPAKQEERTISMRLNTAEWRRLYQGDGEPRLDPPKAEP